jgi:hypothetical protein
MRVQISRRLIGLIRVDTFHSCGFIFFFFFFSSCYYFVKLTVCVWNSFPGQSTLCPSIQSGDNSPYISSIPLTGTIPLSYHWWFHPNHRYVDIPKRTWFQMVWLLISLYIQLLSTMNNFPYRQWVQTGAYNYNLNLFLNKFLNDNEYIIYVHCPRIWNLFVPALESGGKVSLCVQTPMSNKS